MSEINDRLELVLPRGKLVIGQVYCPHGCSLIAPYKKIHGHPSIHLRATHQGRSGSIYLDPVSGMHDNISEIEVPPGEVVEFSCPYCGVSLNDPDMTCNECAGPMFALRLPEGAVVEACRRNGCPGHRLRVITGEQLMQRLFDSLGMDSVL